MKTGDKLAPLLLLSLNDLLIHQNKTKGKQNKQTNKQINTHKKIETKQNNRGVGFTYMTVVMTLFAFRGDNLIAISTWRLL